MSEEEKKEKKRIKDKERYAKKAPEEREARNSARRLKNLTPEKRATEIAAKSARKDAQKANETQQQRANRNRQHAKQMFEFRSNQTAEESQIRREQHAEHMLQVRANETEDQSQIRRERHAEPATVTGWGTLSPGGNQPATLQVTSDLECVTCDNVSLQEVEVTVQSNEECASVYGTQIGE